MTIRRYVERYRQYNLPDIYPNESELSPKLMNRKLVSMPGFNKNKVPVIVAVELLMTSEKDRKP